QAKDPHQTATAVIRVDHRPAASHHTSHVAPTGVLNWRANLWECSQQPDGVSDPTRLGLREAIEEIRRAGVPLDLSHPAYGRNAPAAGAPPRRAGRTSS